MLNKLLFYEIVKGIMTVKILYSSKNFNEKKKHLRVRHKYIINLITYGIISLDFISSNKSIIEI